MKARNPSTGTLETVYVKALDSMPVGAEIDFDGQESDIPTGWEQITYDTGWTTLNTVIKYRKVGNIVQVVGSSGDQVEIGNGFTTVGTLPANFRPSIDIPFVSHFAGEQNTAAVTQSNTIGTDGSIKMYLKSGFTTKYWGWNCMFFVD